MHVTIKQRIIIGFAIVVSLTVLLSFSSLVTLKEIERGIDLVTKEATPIVVIGGQMVSVVLEANRSVVEHVSLDSTDQLEAIETEFVNQTEQASKLKALMIDMTDNIEALSQHTESLETTLERLKQIGPAIFSAHRDAIALNQRVETLSQDFEGMVSELLATIDSHLEDVQGEVEAISSLYALQGTIGKGAEFVAKAHIHRNLVAVENFRAFFPANTEQMDRALSELRKDGNIDALDVQELADLVDLYKNAVLEPELFLDLLIQVLAKEVQYRDDLTDINKSADDITTILKVIIREGETFVNQAEASAADTFASSRTLLYAVSLAAVLLAIGVGWWLMRAIQGPMASVISILTKMSQGDLRNKLDDSKRDEFGNLARCVNSLVEHLSSAIHEIMVSSDTLNKAAELTKSLSDHTRLETEEQKGQTHQAAEAMMQMSGTVTEIARNSERSLSEVKNTSHSAESGHDTIMQAVNSAESLTVHINEASQTVRSLEHSVESIGSILGVIKGIAEQTNLLALNAAIEAARAGEQGRGFAVVSEEVRSLAGRTQQSTKEIEEMIDELQKGAQSTISAMKGSVGYVDKTREYVEAAGKAFHGIVKSMKNISNMSSDIASASEQQNRTTHEIAKNVNRITEIAEGTASGAVEASRHSESLAQVADRLKDQVSHFTIADATSDDIEPIEGEDSSIHDDEDMVAVPDPITDQADEADRPAQDDAMEQPRAQSTG